jgi:hypothetical protein
MAHKPVFSLSIAFPSIVGNPSPPLKNTQTLPTYLPLNKLFFPRRSLFFSLALSLFPNGNPLVLLSAPVVLLTRAASPPNNSVQVPKQNNTPLPISPAEKAKLHPPLITCVYK